MNFSEALDALKAGDRIHATRWPDETYIAMQVPDENSKMNVPYLYLHTQNKNMPWTPIYNDLFTDEWAVVE